MRYILQLIIFMLSPLLTFSQQVAVENQKMNIFYIGVENPIKVIIENYPCNKVVIKTTLGHLQPTSDNCNYIYKTDSCNVYKENIFVGVEEGKKVKWLDTLVYRIKRVPDPTPRVAGKWEGYLSKEKLKNSRLTATLDNFDFDLKVIISNYSVEISRKDSIIYQEKDIQGNKFSPMLLSEIEKGMKEDKIIFYDIIVDSNNSLCWKNIGVVIIKLE